jgi:hypothetical protein
MSSDRSSRGSRHVPSTPTIVPRARRGA